MATTPPSAAGKLEVACLRAHGQRFGMDVRRIREIVRSQPITPLPQAPPLIEGVIDLRGTILPVVDLGRSLGLGPVAEAAAARIVVLEIDGLRLGLRVEAADDVVTLDAEGVEDPPALTARAGYRAVRAVVRRPGAPPLLLLSVEHLIEQLAAPAAAARGVG